MDGVIEGFFFLVNAKQEARKTLIFMNENDNELKKEKIYILLIMYNFVMSLSIYKVK
jgi:hypothetical protein